jgi:hypothetical protein
MKSEKTRRTGIQSRILNKLTRRFGRGVEKKPPFPQSVLSYILTGKRRATPEQATMLEPVLIEMGYAITRFDMVFAYKPGEPLLAMDKTKKEDAYES